MPRLALRRALAALALAASTLVACDDVEPFHDTPAPIKPQTCSGPPRRAVVTNLSFTREDPKGVAPGFDLDRHVSSKGEDDASCRKGDFTAPDGRIGIDNQLAALIPEVEAIVGNAVDGLIQGAINDGLLLIMLDFEGIDDFKNDSCLGVTVHLAEGKPSLGTDGVIEAYQTFSPKPGSTSNHGTNGTIQDGVLTIGPMDVAIPLKLFDVSFTLNVYDAYFRFNTDEDGFLDGQLSGGIVPEELIEGIKDGAGLGDILPLILTVMKTSSDLKPNDQGKCTQLSVAVNVKAVPAFMQTP